MFWLLALREYGGIRCLAIEGYQTARQGGATTLALTPVNIYVRGKATRSGLVPEVFRVRRRGVGEVGRMLAY